MSQQEQTFLAQQFQVALRAYFPGIAFTYHGPTIVWAALELNPFYRTTPVPGYRYQVLADIGLCHPEDPEISRLVPDCIDILFNSSDGITTVQPSVIGFGFAEWPVIRLCPDCLLNFLKQLSFAWVYQGINEQV